MITVNKVKKTGKVLLKITLALCGLYILLKALMVGYFWFIGNPKTDVSSSFLARVVNVAIGVPGKYAPQIITNNPEIEPISQEEWLNMQCDIGQKYKDWGRPPKFKTRQEGQLDCLAADTPNKYRNQQVRKFVCKNYLYCHALQITVDHYILQHPKVLENIIKVAEKPCYYLATPEMIPEGVNKNGIIQSIREYRDELCCDGAPTPRPYAWQRRFVLLSVIDYKKEKSIEILIERKDVK